MHILSTCKETILSDFIDLETKSQYKHAHGEVTDFQFCAQRRIFVEVNKNVGLEVMRIKEHYNEEFELQRMRKLTVNNVYSVACAKQNPDELAVGLSSGHVRLYNYMNAQLIHRFQAEDTRNTVLCLDYNCTDDYIASVLQTGEINIFGIKTKTKMENIKLDNKSTLVRFHPSKRFQLAVASYSGAVTLYDVQSKRKIYHVQHAHKAPCRDICMCTANTSTLISVGYDSKINIFDIRQKTQTKNNNVDYIHPLSTVALSDCGTYFCVGSLKGDLTSYDMRNTKKCLATRQVHDGHVGRIAFLPMIETNVSNNIKNTYSNISTNVATELAPPQLSQLRTGMQTGHLINNDNGSSDDNVCRSLASTSLVQKQRDFVNNALVTPAALARNFPRDSFCDFIEKQDAKVLEQNQASTATIQRCPTLRESFDWDGLARPNIIDDFKNMNRFSNELSPVESEKAYSTETCNNPKSSYNYNAQIRASSYERLGSSEGKTNISLLMEKIEETLSEDNQSVDVEGNSTPLIKNGEYIGDSLDSQRDSPKATEKSSTVPSVAHISTEMRKEFASMRADIDKRFTELEANLNFRAETNKWEIFTQTSNILSKQLESSKEITESLAYLLRQDEFVKSYEKLRCENNALKIKMAEMLQNRTNNES